MTVATLRLLPVAPKQSKREIAELHARIANCRRTLATRKFWVVRCRGPIERDADGCHYSGRASVVMGWIHYHALTFGLESIGFWGFDTALEAAQWFTAVH